MYTPQRDDPQPPDDGPLIPPVEQPRGAAFFFKTWTGRIIIVNTLVFLLTAVLSHDFGLLSVDLDLLIKFGAKDPVKLAQGQYWRLITPMFIHGGLLHYAFNNWALYVLGYQLEHLLRPKRYLALYLLAGIGGTIVSSLMSLAPSVGASGALFGLLGCGFYMERTIQSRIKEITGAKPRAGAYTGMVVANILFGFIIPQIDNAAHIGGLIVGVTFAYVLLRVQANRLMVLQVRKGWIIAGLLALALIVGTIVGSSPSFVLYRLRSAVQSSEQLGDQYYYLNQLLELSPDDGEARWHRLVLSVQAKTPDLESASVDLRWLKAKGGYDRQIDELIRALEAKGLRENANWLLREYQGF